MLMIINVNICMSCGLLIYHPQYEAMFG